MGFIYERIAICPSEYQSATCREWIAVFLNCAICHAGTYRSKPDERPTVVLGMPANTVDLQAFERFLFQCATDERFTPERILSEIEKIGGRLDRLDENLLRGLGVYLMRDRVLLLRDRFDFMNREPEAGPGRVDTFNPPKVLLNFPMHTLPEREWVGNCDLPSIWLQRPRGGLWLHWDGNNDSVQERNRSAAFGTGAYPPSLDREGIRRIEDWIMDATPPKYPFPIDEGRAENGGKLYQEYCASCHGRSGRDFAGAYVGKVTPVKDEPALLVATDFNSPSHLPEKLAAHADPMSQFLWTGFSAEAQKVISEPGDASLKLSVLAAEMNRAIRGNSIFEDQRFSTVKLSDETLALKAQNPQGDALLRLNRLLLQDAYPREIKYSLKGVGTDRWRLDSYTHELAAAQTISTRNTAANGSHIFAKPSATPTRRSTASGCAHLICTMARCLPCGTYLSLPTSAQRSFTEATMSMIQRWSAGSMTRTSNRRNPRRPTRTSRGAATFSTRRKPGPVAKPARSPWSRNPTQRQVW